MNKSLKDSFYIIAAVVLLAAIGIGASFFSRDTSDQDTFSGTVVLGTNIDEKNFCTDGLYLVADPGTYLAGQTTMLLLRDENQEMLRDRAFVGTKVTVRGTYPAQTIFCEALICACEDFILVEEIVRR